MRDPPKLFRTLEDYNQEGSYLISSPAQNSHTNDTPMTLTHQLHHGRFVRGFPDRA